MAIYKCKMCGGTIEFEKGDTVGVCDRAVVRSKLSPRPMMMLSLLFLIEQIICA